MTEPTDRLVRKVRELFGPDVGGLVLDRLRATRDPLGHPVTERVQAAVVKASGGDRRRFEAYAGLADEDWRDVLVAADLGDDDWPARLDEYLGHA